MKLIDFINSLENQTIINAQIKTHGLMFCAAYSVENFKIFADEELLNMPVGFSFEGEDGEMFLSLEGKEIAELRELTATSTNSDT